MYLYRNLYEVNKKAATDIATKYDPNIIGEVCLQIFNLHCDQEIHYEFDEDAEELYEQIFDKYNGQFNLKYSGNLFIPILTS